MKTKVMAILLTSSALIGALTGILTYQWSISIKGAKVGCYHVTITNIKKSVTAGEVKRALLKCPYVVQVKNVRVAPYSCDAYVIVKSPAPISNYELTQKISRALKKAGLGRAPAVFLKHVNAYVVEVAVKNPRLPASEVARKLAKAPTVLAVFKAQRRGSIYEFEVASLDDDYPVAYSITGTLQALGLQPLNVANVTPVKWGYTL